MSDRATTAAEVASAVSITAGVGLVSVPAALVVAGLLGLLFVWALAQ